MQAAQFALQTIGSAGYVGAWPPFSKFVYPMNKRVELGHSWSTGLVITVKKNTRYSTEILNLEQCTVRSTKF